MGPWDRFVIALIPIVLILAVTVVIIVRPLSKRLADLLELLIDDRDTRQAVGVEEVLERLDAIEGRIAQIEGTRASLEKGGAKESPVVGRGESG